MTPAAALDACASARAISPGTIHCLQLSRYRPAAWKRRSSTCSGRCAVGTVAAAPRRASRRVPARDPGAALRTHKVLIAQHPCRVEAPLITGRVHEPVPRIEQLGPLDCALVKDMLIGRLVPCLDVEHEHRPAVNLQPRLEHCHGEVTTRQAGHGQPDALLGVSRSLREGSLGKEPDSAPFDYLMSVWTPLYYRISFPSYLWRSPGGCDGGHFGSFLRVCLPLSSHEPSTCVRSVYHVRT